MNSIVKQARSQKLNYSLPADLRDSFAQALQDWLTHEKVGRLWSGDKTLWTSADENRWLGWLSVASREIESLPLLEAFQNAVRASAYSHVLLLGMGGSSLCPEVLTETFGQVEGFPKLLVLDSTDPQQVARIEREIDIANTLFIVSSKSGSTLEPNIFYEYFFKRANDRLGLQEASANFIAITDPGSALEKIARARNFGQIFFGEPEIGGRYSALSNFGIIPAAVMGIDLQKWLNSAQAMVEKSKPDIALEENQGVVLGLLMGICARAGCDKVTFVTSPGVASLGSWLEQLLAESTGKHGKGLIPIDQEVLTENRFYGQDRLFVSISLNGEPAQTEALQALAQIGHPVVQIELNDLYDLAGEFFKWEIATAVAGSVLQINPFDQPDVEAAKKATRALTDEFTSRGYLPAEKPTLQLDGLDFYAGQAVREQNFSIGSADSIESVLRRHLSSLRADDYFGILAYIDRDESNQAELQSIRSLIQKSKRVATCVEFGPRYLHSTGQDYKGGPNTGVFIELTCDDAEDLKIPGEAYTFGVVKAAQARGDFAVLSERGRRVIRIHMGSDPSQGLRKLRTAFESALS
jgi:transaldolase/glucose-6-phosphate isomerase